MKIEVEKITLDPELQPRNELDADAIQQYSADMKAGDIFPPVEVIKVNGRYYLTSGWHRTLAAKRAELQAVEVIVIEGTMDDALLAACASNVEHDQSGNRRKNVDKQKAVKMALKVKQHNGQLNYSEIAEHVGVSHTMVQDWYKRLYGEKNHNLQTLQIVKPVTSDPTPERQPDIFERIEERRKDDFWEDQEIKEIQKEIKTESRAKLNKPNENIEWAAGIPR